MTKTLILNGNKYKYYTTKWNELGSTATETDYITYGMNDVSIITESAWKELTGVVEFKCYTDNSISEIQINIETETFTLENEIGDELNIIEYTDNDSQNNSIVIAETEAFSLYDNFGGNFDLLYYTTNSAKSSASLDITQNYSPLDDLDGDFKLVTYTENTNPTDFKTTVNSTPFGQIVIEKSDLLLYGDLSKMVINRLKESGIPQGKIRTLISFDSGVNWFTFKNNSWIKVSSLSESEFINNGMTMNRLFSIRQSNYETQLNTITPTIKLAYYIDDYPGNITSSKLINVSTTQNSATFSPEVSDMSLYVLNTVSTIEMTLTGKQLEGKISDVDNGKVRYKISVNGKPYYPNDGSFTGLESTPLNIAIRVDESVILIGKTNTVRVDFEDYWGASDYWETSFVGTYNGLMFLSPEGEYYSSDISKVLKYLDMGTLIAGQVSSEYKIKLKNTNGYDVKNVNLFTTTKHTGITLELSDSNTPFTAKDSLFWSGIMHNGDEKEFYIRMATRYDAPSASNGTFEVRVNADKV